MGKSRTSIIAGGILAIVGGALIITSGYRTGSFLVTAASYSEAKFGIVPVGAGVFDHTDRADNSELRHQFRGTLGRPRRGARNFKAPYNREDPDWSGRRGGVYRDRDFCRVRNLRERVFSTRHAHRLLAGSSHRQHRKISGLIQLASRKPASSVATFSIADFAGPFAKIPSAPSSISA